MYLSMTTPCPSFRRNKPDQTRCGRNHGVVPGEKGRLLTSDTGAFHGRVCFAATTRSISSERHRRFAARSRLYCPHRTSTAPQTETDGLLSAKYR